MNFALSLILITSLALNIGLIAFIFYLNRRMRVGLEDLLAILKGTPNEHLS